MSKRKISGALAVAMPFVMLGTVLTVGAIRKIQPHSVVQPGPRGDDDVLAVVKNWDYNQFQLIADPRSEETLKDRERDCAGWAKEFGLYEKSGVAVQIEADSPNGPNESSWYSIAVPAQFSKRNGTIYASFRQDDGRWVLSSLHVKPAQKISTSSDSSQKPVLITAIKAE
jgi:hypothetical protein